jgi:hypothetical protein
MMCVHPLQTLAKLLTYLCLYAFFALLLAMVAVVRVGQRVFADGSFKNFCCPLDSALDWKELKLAQNLLRMQGYHSIFCLTADLQYLLSVHSTTGGFTGKLQDKECPH